MTRYATVFSLAYLVMDLFTPLIKSNLLWQLPATERWDYVDHAERTLVDLIKNELCISVDHFTEGFAPAYDVRVNVPEEECTIDFEIKFTQKADLFVECVYGNGNDSGLFASKSDFYLVVSPGLKNEIPVGKVRLYATWKLIEYGNYIVEKKGIKSHEASDSGPGSHGFYLNCKDFDKYMGEHACIWIGNIDYYVDETDSVVYDLSKFIETHGSNLMYFMRDVRKINRMKQQGSNNE